MVGLKTGPMFYRIGTGSFLHSFFSTITYNLEDLNLTIVKNNYAIIDLLIKYLF